MDAEKQPDSFPPDSFPQFAECLEPTSSQEAEFSKFPFTKNVGSNRVQYSSSPYPTPSEPTEIVMISASESSSSDHEHIMEEDAVFLTPPEHHSHSQLSSSEDQNPNELTIFEAGDRSDRTANVRVSETGLDDDPEAKRVGAEFQNETVPLGETEGVHDTGVIVSEIGDSVRQERATLIMPKGSSDVAGTIGCMMNDGNHELGGKCECVEEFHGETDPLGEIEGVHDAGVMVSDTRVSVGEERALSIMAEGSSDATGEGRMSGCLMKDGVTKSVAISGFHELGGDCECVEELDGKTVLLGKTQGVLDAVVIVSDSGSSVGEDRADSTLGEGSSDIADDAGTIGCLMKGGETKFVANNGNHELDEDIGLIRGDKCYEDSDSSESLDSDAIEREITKIKHNAGARCNKVKLNSDVCGSEEVVKASEEVEMPEDSSSHRDRGVRSNGKRVEEIEEFRYAADVSGRPVVRRRLLPPLKGKENGVVEISEKKSVLLEFWDELNAVVGDRDGGSDEVDFFETAKRRGWTFPKARWWPSDGNKKK